MRVGVLNRWARQTTARLRDKAQQRNRRDAKQSQRTTPLITSMASS